MANIASIERREIRTLRNGKTWKEAYIFDDYGNGSFRFDTLPDDDLELLRLVLNEQTEGGYESIEQIFDYVIQEKTSVFIDGKYYEWEQVKTIFDEYQNEKIGE